MHAGRPAGDYHGGEELIRDIEKVYVVSRSYGDETKYFPVAATLDKDVANALTKAFGGIVTEVPCFQVIVDYKEDEDERY